MVRNIFKTLNKEISGVHQAAFLLGFFALASQFLALIRDRLLAHNFGAGQTLDVYYAAFRVPDLIYLSIASLVSISVLIPFFSGMIEDKKEETKDFFDALFTSFMIMMIVVSVIAYIFLPKLTNILLPGASLKEAADVASLSRILLIQPICLGISNLLGIVTQMYKRFFIYALSPVFYNAMIIFGIIFLSPYYGIKGVVAGVVLGGIAHFLIQIPFVWQKGFVPRFRLKFDRKKLFKIMMLSVPRTITLSAVSIESIFITSFASLMSSGSIAVFNFSLNLQSVPLAIIGVSYASAAFPTLSALFCRGEREKFLEHMNVAARQIIFLSLPVTALFVVLRAQIVRVILGSGHFSWNDTRLTAACLALFTVSLVAQGLEILFIRAYYAAGKTTKPLMVNLISSVLTITLPYVFMKLFTDVPVFAFFIESLFKIEHIPGSIVLMLPLGFSIGTIINAIVFWFMFAKDFSSSAKPLTVTFFHSFAGAVIMGFAAYIGLGISAPWFNDDTLMGVFSQGLTGGVFGIAVGLFILKLLRNPELEELIQSLQVRFSRIKKDKIVVPEPEKVDIS
ncbi:MAG: lipid II flippase MurJ [Candidatus Pacebacteria bacterium]|nr:lipid II flippase MurJ [Candidatus Paceibacterota bacterium]